MSDSRTSISRRQFLGGSAAAVSGLALGPLPASGDDAPRPSPALGLSDLAPPPAPDERYWWKVRSQFNLIDGLTFMNNGTLGPVPKVVADENDRVAREIGSDPTNGYRNEELHEKRKILARFVGAAPEEIAYTRSTTEGMNIFAHGIDWREGDEILMGNHEHDGGVEPYLMLEKRRGVKIRRVDIPSPPESIDQIVSLYEKAITPKTRAIMISHVTYVTGLVMPMKALSEMGRRKGILTSVDGAHPLGMMALDLHDIGCDHYAAAGQKWLLCGTGTGLSYFRQDVQDRIWPLMGAGGSVGADGVRNFHKDARRYEDCGQRDVPSALGMLAAVQLQETIGKKNIEARVRQLSSRLREGLEEIEGVRLWTSKSPELSCGLTLFSVRQIPMANVKDAIMERDRIYIRDMRTGNLNAVRASTHIYNMPEEVDRLIESVRYVASHWADYMTAPTA
ncbi:MAG TPA: aminotransferase class V-fold PLP-dependent enzyme [Vicinamibacteria bacterium]|nr:aminotransferase class V-fold PLP-dependent enzyme [Vicinamibacteria bacterium]